MATANATTNVTLPSDREILITRVFDAPRELVFKACTDPDLIPRWWGPRAFTTTVEKMDLRPGGKWRFLNRAPDGNEYGFEGEYREVVPPERIVDTFEFDGVPGKVQVQTATFTERDGKTELTIRVVFDSKEDRDGMLHSGMEVGMRESHDRLAELLSDGRVGEWSTPRTPVPDMKLELVPLPVSDVDRAKAFYVENCGFKLEVDVRISDTMRVVQLTPPGSKCTIVLAGKSTGVTDMQPGSVKGLHLVVQDIDAAREALSLRGVAVGDVEDIGGVKYVWFDDPDGNQWGLQYFPANLRR
ncbi:MAG TPA: SRPBCC domain-containing protein [Candidatus Limnocylindria bacterium]|nr:SRPBCC domain-containing protein [Candidatus Limnocylindria bacterium]